MCDIELNACRSCLHIYTVSMAYCPEVRKRHGLDAASGVFAVKTFCWSPWEGCQGLVFGQPVGLRRQCPACRM